MSGSLDKNGVVGSLDKAVRTPLTWRNTIRVIPPAGERAFLMRDADDTEDRFFVEEDGDAQLGSANVRGDLTLDGPDLGRFLVGPNSGYTMLQGQFRTYGGDLVQTQDRNWRPNTDDMANVGTDSYRFSLVRAVTITSGQLGFEEKSCFKCGEPFEEGDAVLLLVRNVSNVTATIPIHEKCKNSPKKRVKIEIPVLEEKYRLTSEGEVEKVMAPKTETKTEKSLSPGITFDEKTGKFLDSEGEEVEPEWEEYEVEAPVFEEVEVEI